MSYYLTSAYSHYIILSFKAKGSYLVNIMGSLPHPSVLEKSLPVPMGITVKITSFMAIPEFSIY